MCIKKDITDYEGLYKVDEYGNIYSTPSDGKPSKILKQEIVKRNNTNYRRVTLSKNGKVKRFQVHRLVAEAFLPKIENKPFINHIDNNGENNHISNLEWVTHSENMIHAQKQGRLFCAQSKGGKISGKNAIAKRIKRLNKMLGKKFNNRKLISIESLGHHPKGKFECLVCNKIFIADIDSTLSLYKKDKYLSCKSCSNKYHKRKNKNNIKI